MGVAGLWDVLRPAGTLRSLTHLAVVDGFEKNTSGLRGLRIGIDASIWFFHAAYGREGENPELRTLFFRCCKLMGVPFLPVFVFDGPKRPKVKRGKKVSGNKHWLTTGMKNIIEAFGFEHRTAPGEAEAELAYLNRIGVIDAVLSDDVDNFLFGATMVIRNPSATLSGNRSHPTKNADGRDDGNHSTVYTSAAIAAHPDIQLARPGLILIGLLSGGDYNTAGVPGCGPASAHALARAGLGDSLMEAAEQYKRDEDMYGEEIARERLDEFLDDWRKELKAELTTNKSGFMKSKKPSLAKAVGTEFPDIEVLLSYTHPITSETEKKRPAPVTFAREPDLGGIASLCELYFEWGVKPIIIKRFRTVLWPSAVQRILRRSVLDKERSRLKGRNGRRTPDADPDDDISMPQTPKKNKPRPTPGTPSRLITKFFSSQGNSRDASLSGRDSDSESGSDSDSDFAPLFTKIHSARTHASTDGIRELRLQITPAQLVHLASKGVTGVRPPIEDDDNEEDDEEDDDEEEGGKKKKRGTKPPPDPHSALRVWMPECMVRLAEPELVEKWEAAERDKAERKAGKGKAKSTGKTTKAKGKARATAAREDSDSDVTARKKTLDDVRATTDLARRKQMLMDVLSSSPVRVAPAKGGKSRAEPLYMEEEESEDDAPPPKLHSKPKSLLDHLDRHAPKPAVKAKISPRTAEGGDHNPPPPRPSQRTALDTLGDGRPRSSQVPKPRPKPRYMEEDESEGDLLTVPKPKARTLPGRLDASTRDSSSSSRAQVPKPKPKAKIPDFMELSDSDEPPPPSQQTNTRRYPTSGSDAPAVTKSPRRGRTHMSPRSAARGSPSRSMSPTPRRKPADPRLPMDVIDLSSDSDGPMLKPSKLPAKVSRPPATKSFSAPAAMPAIASNRLRPLDIARSRVRAKMAQDARTAAPLVNADTNKPRAMEPEDIIDLT